MGVGKGVCVVLELSNVSKILECLYCTHNE